MNDEPLRTTAEAADMIGRSPETIRRWRRHGYFKPTATDPLTEEALWSPVDIRAMRLHLIASRAERIVRIKKFWRRDVVPT